MQGCGLYRLCLSGHQPFKAVCGSGDTALGSKSSVSCTREPVVTKSLLLRASRSAVVSVMTHAGSDVDFTHGYRRYPAIVSLRAALAALPPRWVTGSFHTRFYREATSHYA